MNPLTAGAVLVSPYFYSFGTACTLPWTHRAGLLRGLPRLPGASSTRNHPEQIRYVFVHVPEERFFGFEEIAVLRQASRWLPLSVPCSMPSIGPGSRAVSVRCRGSCRGEPPKFPGMSSSVSREGGPRLRWFSAWATSLTWHGVELPDHVRNSLLELVRPKSKIQLGSRRRWGASGKLVRPWNVIDNVPRDVLVSKHENAGRRVVFPKRESVS